MNAADARQTLRLYGVEPGSLADTPPHHRSQIHNHEKSPLVVGSVVRAAAGTGFIHCEPWLTKQRMQIVGVAVLSRSQRDDAKEERLKRMSGIRASRSNRACRW